MNDFFLIPDFSEKIHIFFEHSMVNWSDRSIGELFFPQISELVLIQIAQLEFLNSARCIRPLEAGWCSGSQSIGG